MKITILANKDIASNFAINKLLTQLSAHDITIFLSAKVGGNNHKPKHLEQLKFFEQDLFNQLIFPLLTSDTTNGKYRSFDQISTIFSRPILELNNINTNPELNVFKASEPDLVISIRYGVILKNEVISVPRYGVINLHSGLLPNYRGVMATFWALLNGETEIGSTLHFINDSNIDTGDIIATSSMSIEKKKSYLWHVLALYKGGCELIIDNVEKLEKNEKIQTLPQPLEGNYYSFPQEVDLQSFYAKDLILYDESELIAFIRDYYY